MTDPNQNNQRPEDWNQNPYSPGGGQQSPEQQGPHQGFPQGTNQGVNQPPYQGANPNPYQGATSGPNQGANPGPNQGFPAPSPEQPGGYGQPAPQYMPGQPGVGNGGPANPGGNGGNGTKVSIAIIATMVLLTAIATVIYFVVRDNDDTDGGTAASSSTAPTSILGDDTLSEDWSTTPPESGGDNSLDPRWSALVPASLLEHLELCSNTSFPILIEGSPDSEVDGATCYLMGSSALGFHRVDILTDNDRYLYLEDTLNGHVEGMSGEIFRQDGDITVGVSETGSGYGVALYYIDASTDLSVEMMNFTDAADARSAAEELGIL